VAGESQFVTPLLKILNKEISLPEDRTNSRASRTAARSANLLRSLRRHLRHRISPQLTGNMCRRPQNVRQPCPRQKRFK